MGVVSGGGSYDTSLRKWEKEVPKYEVIIYWSEEDKALIAEVPELPGCAADGQSYQEALRNVEDIIQEWLELARDLGRPISIQTEEASYLFASLGLRI